MLILISAGEASGEMYGAQLIEALRRAAEQEPVEHRSAWTGEAPVPTPADQLSFFGVGGERMRAAGCDTIIDAKDLSVVGITEIVSHLPKIYRLFHKLIAEADARKPDLAVVIDSPAFNWRVAREMKKRGIPTVYYVAPQFWAWRQGRVRLLRKYIDKALVIFPFEEQFYRERGVDATFVGHPLAELPQPAIERSEYASQFNLDPAKQWITLMPGSRMKEVRMNLPSILESAALLDKQYECLLPVAPTLNRDFLSEIVQSAIPPAAKAAPNRAESTVRLEAAPFQSKDENDDTRSVSEPLLQTSSERASGITLVLESLPALAHSRAAIVASGTATVEAAMMSTPFVMVYRVSRMTYLLGRPRVKVPHFAMVNLIAGEEVVPELVQNDFTAQNVVTRLREILPDGPRRELMIRGLAGVKAKLRAPSAAGSPLHPADRAAEIILSLLRGTEA